MIEYVLEDAPDLFGNVLPHVMAISRRKPWDSVLVTELIEEEATRMKGGMLVGGIPVPEEEQEMLLESGLTAIRRLHAVRVAHRDVGTRNLRVAREEDEKRQVESADN